MHRKAPARPARAYRTQARSPQPPGLVRLLTPEFAFRVVLCAHVWWRSAPVSHAASVPQLAYSGAVRALRAPAPWTPMAVSALGRPSFVPRAPWGEGTSWESPIIWPEVVEFATTPLEQGSYSLSLGGSAEHSNSCQSHQG